MLLFYVPLRDAINAIPEKVKSADEIGVLGVSLKTTLRVEAEKIGAFQLSETLPALTPVAVEVLLRASRHYNTLISYSTEGDLVKTIWLPSEKRLATLEELEAQDLITVDVDGTDEPESTEELRAAIVAFRKKYPGRESDENSFSDEELITWKLDRAQVMETPHYNWKLTHLGGEARDVIVKAVSSQLALQPDKKPNSAK
jgi:hypothetical protein